MFSIKSCYKADDADRLAPIKEDNAIMRKKDRNGVAILG